MTAPLRFKDANGFPYQRDGAEVLYARSRGQNCELYFENGTVEIYGYPLIYFHKQIVWHTNQFRRLGKYLLVKVARIKSHTRLKLLLDNGMVLPLTRCAHLRLKAYLQKHPILQK